MSFTKRAVPTLLAASWLGTALVCAGRWRLIRPGAINIPRLSEMATLLKTGIEFHATAFAGILFQNADRAICITYFSHADLGRYAVALALSGAGLGVVSSATSIVIFPKLAAAQSFAARRHLIRNALGASCIVALLINASIALAIPLLLPFLFGQDYAEAVPAAILLCIAQITPQEATRIRANLKPALAGRKLIFQNRNLRRAIQERHQNDEAILIAEFNDLGRDPVERPSRKSHGLSDFTLRLRTHDDTVFFARFQSVDNCAIEPARFVTVAHNAPDTDRR